MEILASVCSRCQVIELIAFSTFDWKSAGNGMYP
jgi:hypothetical protein